MYIEVEDIKKSYGTETKVQVLKGITTAIKERSMCVIYGPSGSGKSTFLNIIGALDTIDSGHLRIGGTELANKSSQELAAFRRETLGFVFQFYNLIPNLTVRENIQVCEYLSPHPLSIVELLDTLGLNEHQNKYPSQLSGGQQQRCAIARALVKNPKLLLCDEPTGALDSVTSKEILVLLEKINQHYGTTMLLVTHNTAIKDMVHQVIKIKDGVIEEDYLNENRILAKDVEW